MNNQTIESREALVPQEFGVYEEVSTLKKTLSWGPVGTEAILSSMLDPDESLYVGVVDPIPAREQYRNFEAMLQNRGCEVVRVKDLLAWELKNNKDPIPAKSLREFEHQIISKSQRLSKQYKVVYKGDLHLIMPILEEDAEEYGEETAIRLNSLLCQTQTDELPMGNLLFGRDQSNLIGDTLFWSRMSKRIREPEVTVWKLALKEYLANQKSFEVTGNGRLEGGDTIVHNGNCLIGVGGRTNEIGVMQVAPEIYKQGLNVYAVYHPERANGKMEHQTTMHLDTFYMPAPKNTCVIYLEEAKDRQVTQLMGKNSKYDGQVISTFAEYLVNSGVDIIPITEDQQRDYQANFVVLDNETVLVTKKDKYLRGEFEKRGIKVIDGNLDAITKGYGGAHCSLTPILRI